MASPVKLSKHVSIQNQGTSKRKILQAKKRKSDRNNRVKTARVVVNLSAQAFVKDFTLEMGKNNSSLGFFTYEKRDFCFSGKFFLGWIEKKYEIGSMKKSFDVCCEVLANGYIKSAQKKLGFSKDYIYYFAGIMEGTSTLNDYKFNLEEVTDTFTTVQYSQELLLKILKIHFILKEKSILKKRAPCLDIYTEFYETVSHLKYYQIDDLTPKEKLAFFLNIYHTLLLHGIIASKIIVNSKLAWKKFSNTIGYNISGELLSLKNIESILLDKYSKNFKKKEVYNISIKKYAYLIPFGLSYCNRWSPRIEIFSEENVFPKLKNNYRQSMNKFVTVHSLDKVKFPSYLGKKDESFPFIHIEGESRFWNWSFHKELLSFDQLKILEPSSQMPLINYYSKSYRFIVEIDKEIFEDLFLEFSSSTLSDSFSDEEMTELFPERRKHHHERENPLNFSIDNIQEKYSTKEIPNFLIDIFNYLLTCENIPVNLSLIGKRLDVVNFQNVVVEGSLNNSTDFDQQRFLDLLFAFLENTKGTLFGEGVADEIEDILATKVRLSLSVILKEKEVCQSFRKYLETISCDFQLDFLNLVKEYEEIDEKDTDLLETLSTKIIDKYILPESKYEVNITGVQRNNVLDAPLLPKKKKFALAKNEILGTLRTGPVFQFLRSDIHEEYKKTLPLLLNQKPLKKMKKLLLQSISRTRLIILYYTLRVAQRIYQNQNSNGISLDELGELFGKHIFQKEPDSDLFHSALFTKLSIIYSEIFLDDLNLNILNL